ncbi:Acb2/Tad1 domain-containing protein [Actinoplanes philippinensis]|uniref:Acb2/Tad1 domain-containing protein n=1 Tax=Actinoplanes philippinensis TaxID=35752 RepID=UPI003F4D40D1
MPTPGLAQRFTHHPPRTSERINAHGAVRAACAGLAEALDASLPEGREKALALTRVEEAMFWANAAIARQP